MDNSDFGRLPLEWIRAFESAARTGSFTAAAAETGLTQSAISQRIGHLETRLGARLFLRGARSVDLSPEGEAWLPHVQLALGGLRDSAEDLFGVGQRHLTISASASVIALWIVPRLAELTRTTGAQVSLRTMVVAADYGREDATLAIRYGTGDWPAAFNAPLYEELLAPVAAPGRDGDWRDWPRIAVSGPRPGWTDWCAATGTPTTPVPTLRFDTFALAAAAAMAGQGVLLASLPLVAPALEAGHLRRLGPDSLAHHETYWLTAGRDRLSRRQWDQLRSGLCTP